MLLNIINKLQWQEKTIDISCSIGISISNSQQDDYNKLYQQADDALYKAKRQGKRNLCYENLPETEN